MSILIQQISPVSIVGAISASGFHKPPEKYCKRLGKRSKCSLEHDKIPINVVS